MKIDNSYSYANVNSTDTVAAAATKSASAEAKQIAKEADAKKNVDTMDFSGKSNAVKESMGIYSRSTVSIKNESMKEMVQNLLSGQALNSTSGQSDFTSQINEMLKQYGITPVEHNDADDKDYWNAENTANRILDFAKNLAGNNQELFGTLKGAFEKAFGECEKIWGDKLPDVCYNTRELVFKGFEEIENSFNKTENAVEETTATEKAAE